MYMEYSTYSEYLSMPKAMPIDKMIAIHSQIVNECGDDPDALELYEDLVKAAIRYAEIRAEWSMMAREKKLEKDFLRTSMHNSVIMHVNVLARHLKKVGKLALWRNELGNEEEDLIFRKVIGDFACYVAFINGICAR